MAHSVDLVSVGHAAADLIVSVPDAFLKGHDLAKGATTRLSSDDFDKLLTCLPAEPAVVAGGCAVNTAAGLVAFGGTARLLARLGKDRFGAVLQQEIAKSEIDFPVQYDVLDRPSLRCLVLTSEDGERSFVVHQDFAELEEAEIKADDFIAAKIGYFEAYPLDNESGQKALVKALHYSKKYAGKTIFNLSDPLVVTRHRDFMMGLIKDRKIDGLIANSNELSALFDGALLEESLHRLQEMSPNLLIAVTRGEKGAVVQQGAERYSLPAKPVQKIVDSCGAGDHFAAGFLFGISQKLPLRFSAELGGIAAAAILQQQGTIPSVLYQRRLSQIKKKLAVKRGTPKP